MVSTKLKLPRTSVSRSNAFRSATFEADTVPPTFVTKNTLTASLAASLPTTITARCPVDSEKLGDPPTRAATPASFRPPGASKRTTRLLMLTPAPSPAANALMPSAAAPFWKTEPPGMRKDERSITSRSTPLPEIKPVMLSNPFPAAVLSKTKVSEPPPPESVSSPARPESVSFDRPPLILSPNDPPNMLSALSVPTRLSAIAALPVAVLTLPAASVIKPAPIFNRSSTLPTKPVTPSRLVPSLFRTMVTVVPVLLVTVEFVVENTKSGVAPSSLFTSQRTFDRSSAPSLRLVPVITRVLVVLL